jgi:hypothetical protein
MKLKSLDPMFAMMQRLSFGNLLRFGLRRHAMGGGTRMLRDGFIATLKSRRIDAVNEMMKFTADAAKLRRGHKVYPDVVICATGYKTGLATLFGDFGVLDDKGYPLHPMGQMNTNNPGLWFTGFKPIFQGFFQAAGISAEWIATAIAEVKESSACAQHAATKAMIEKPQFFLRNGIK